MTQIHTIKLKDLDANYIQKLKDKHPNPNQEISIWVQNKSFEMPEDEFWYVISLLKKGNDISLSPAIQYLSSLSVEKIAAFEDILSEKLYWLDGQKYAEQIGEGAYQGEDAPFSADNFLYARCFAVIQGKKQYENILTNPTQTPSNQTFEPLLNLAALAYEQKTGAIFDYIPAFVYETFANQDGWKGSDFLSKFTF